MSSACRLSVVVPLAPGEDDWKQLVDSLLPLPARAELVLVFSSKRDADKQDKSVNQVRTIVCPGKPGRAGAMNFGAAAAKGDFLWFLHADSRVQDGTIDLLLNKGTGPTEGIWYFDLKFRADGPWPMWINSTGVWLRSRLFKMPFGDQGFFMPVSTFNNLGGFPENAEYGEDHLLIWKARRQKIAIVPLRVPIYTSARKYRDQGWFNTTKKHVYLTWRQALPELYKLMTGVRS